MGFGAADEPHAAQAGREMLEAGGTAADAAVAMGLTLAVTLPARAGLGGYGLCVVHDSKMKTVRTLDFLPQAEGNGGVAAPTLLRGMALLHASLGRLRWEQVVAKAEALARDGVPVSRALAIDLEQIRFGDGKEPGLHRLPLMTANGRPLTVGDTLTQPDLAAVLTRVRVQGAGIFFDGILGRKLADGLGLEPAGVRSARARWTETATVSAGNDTLHFADAGGDTGGGGGPGGRSRGAALASAWQAVADGAGITAATLGEADLGGSVATTGLVAIDPDENGVACAFSMGTPFGTGRMVPGTGVIGARSAGLAGIAGPVLRINPYQNTSTLAAVGTTGELGAREGSAAATAALFGVLRQATENDRPAEEAVAARSGGGRTNLVSCRYNRVEGFKTCSSATDPRGTGMAFGIQRFGR
ncbi:Gamma-glutamyltranspeptidase [uncultured Gammaproteobacteria bacterium]